MNNQTQILNPSYSLRQSNLSMGKTQAQPNLYAASQVNLYPGNPQQQYFVTSSVTPQQITSSLRPQQLASTHLGANNLYGQTYNGGFATSTKVYNDKKESQSRITYHPYTRTYIDYEERVILVPVERVKINYYEKIYETQYVPQAVQQIVTETVPVQKEVLNVKYIPVQQKIIHFPKDDKKVGSLGQVQKKVIYYDATGQQITKSRHEAKLKGTSNYNVVLRSQLASVPQINYIVQNPVPSYIPVQVVNNQVSQVTIAPVTTNDKYQDYQEQQQIILNQQNHQPSKKLGQSHVKEVYIPNYDPKNEPLNTF